MVDSDTGLAPSDVVLADTHGETACRKPAIGRILALTEADLDDGARQDRGLRGERRRLAHSVVLSADKSDSQGDFTGASDAFAASVPPFVAVGKAYLDQLAVSDARAWCLGAS